MWNLTPYQMLKQRRYRSRSGYRRRSEGPGGSVSGFSESGDTKTNESGAENRKLISETLLLALVPIVGYAMAYIYELGYAAVFHVPTSLISLTLTTGLAIAFNLIIASFAYAPMLSLFATWLIVLWHWPVREEALFRLVLPMMLAQALAVLAAIYLVPTTCEYVILGEGIALLGWALVPIWGFAPLFKQVEYDPTPFSTSYRDIVSVGLVALTCTVLIASLTFCAGENSALTPTQQFFVGDKRSSILVNVSGDMIITAPVTKDKANLGSFYLENRLDVSKQKPGDDLKLYLQPASLEIRSTFANWWQKSFERSW